MSRPAANYSIRRDLELGRQIADARKAACRAAVAGDLAAAAHLRRLADASSALLAREQAGAQLSQQEVPCRRAPRPA